MPAVRQPRSLDRLLSYEVQDLGLDAHCGRTSAQSVSLACYSQCSPDRKLVPTVDGGEGLAGYFPILLLLYIPLGPKSLSLALCRAILIERRRETQEQVAYQIECACIIHEGASERVMKAWPCPLCGGVDSSDVEVGSHAGATIMGVLW